MTRCKQNFSKEAEDAIVEQINMELMASYIYLAMYSVCAGDEMGLYGLAQYFLEAVDEERQHAQKLLDYLIKRGGSPRFPAVVGIERPSEMGSPLDMLEKALELEKQVNASLLNICKIAEVDQDYHLGDYIESEFLSEQIESIKKLSDMVTRLSICGGQGLGLFVWDESLKKSRD